LQERGPTPFPDKKIHESRTGDLHFLQDLSEIINLPKDPGDLTRILSRLCGKDHGRIGGVIPVPGILCHLHFDGGKPRHGKSSPVDAHLNGFLQKCNQQLFHE
jgi:hypothetical protein